MGSLNFILSKFDESIEAEFVGDIDYPIIGQFVVSVPDGVQIDTPVSNYTDLKSKKYAGIAAVYPDFPDQIWDEFDTATRIDTTLPDHKADVGKYEVMLKEVVGPNNGRITTTAQAMGYVPTELIILWSVYKLTRTVNAQGGIDISYEELDSTEIDVEVSVDGGGSWDTATYATLVTPTVPGSSFVARFTNTNSEERYVGYYSMLYRP